MLCLLQPLCQDLMTKDAVGIAASLTHRLLRHLYPILVGRCLVFLRGERLIQVGLQVHTANRLAHTIFSEPMFLEAPTHL
jgi:hypothetical protein